MTIRKLSSALLVSMLFLGAAIAHAEDYKTTIKLALGSNGNILGESYVLTVPDSLTVTTKGWNKIGEIHAVKEGTADFNTAKKLVVTLSSDNGGNSFYLSSGTNTLTYTVATAEGGSAITGYTFTAAEINAGASQDIGIYVTWESSQASGTYEDTITYTASVKDLVTKTVTWTAGDINSTPTVTKDGVTLTAKDIDVSMHDIHGDGTFTTASGKFTKIEVTAYSVGIKGDGWSGGTWTGNAASVSFSGDIYDAENGVLKIVFTIEE